ncbi:hypothetical protein J0H58_02635 [bacterium]|nr:hypothetical protein [bacterium]
MARLLTVVAAIALLLVMGVSSAAPIPEGARPAPLYHATGVGATNTYRWHHGGEFSDTVAAVEDHRGVKRVTYRRLAKSERFPQPPITFKVEVSPAGVRVTDIVGGSAWRNRMAYWSFQPHQARWQYVSSTPWERATHTVTSFPPERVAVPAGTFDAVRVHDVWAYDAEGFGPQEQTEWWAPGVGVVKMLYQDHNGTESFVLKSFTRGDR